MGILDNISQVSALSRTACRDSNDTKKRDLHCRVRTAPSVGLSVEQRSKQKRYSERDAQDLVSDGFPF
jgi:hypothetical protein